MPAFRGTFEHSLDQRGRIAVPARYRDAFTDGGVLTPSADGCLELYPAAAFDQIAEALTAEGANLQRGRRLRRALYARSWDVELDKQGRILIPLTMRELVQVDEGSVLAGRGECLELWSQERWNEEAVAVDRDYAANLEAQEQATS
ncbi:MAG TPA: cell division/cell wall cluster transcriptional repressor MraZ [Dehalococcoidia bacterium]|nr:cell division/cell wall cluster transcriptional repressor MraZ [Dehalococcoidia bacterium]